MSGHVTEASYLTVMTCPASKPIPFIWAMKMAATASYRAVPSILSVAPTGMTNRVTLRSIPLFSSKQRKVIGMVAALKVKCSKWGLCTVFKCASQENACSWWWKYMELLVKGKSGMVSDLLFYMKTTSMFVSWMTWHRCHMFPSTTCHPPSTSVHPLDVTLQAYDTASIHQMSSQAHDNVSTHQVSPSGILQCLLTPTRCHPEDTWYHYLPPSAILQTRWWCFHQPDVTLHTPDMLTETTKWVI